MKTPRSSSLRRSLRALCALGLTLTASAALAGGAGAYVSPEAAQEAATHGAQWFESEQQASGQLASDWAMTALAAADVNAADVRTSLLDPSAQDYYLDEWRASGPGGSATDAERGILAGVAGGLQPARLSTAADTKTSNLVARIAETFDGTQIGDPGLLNDDIFGVLALQQAGAPRPLLTRIVDRLRGSQLPGGGWTWNNSPGAPADTDMTGSAIAAFCAAGVGLDDPALQQALTLLHSLQDPATGGFIAPPESFGIGVNVDTTAWVTSGLIQCGIDPQGPEWTTAQGKTPLDYLVSMQEPDGHFRWTAEFDGGAFEAYDAIRPLGGVAFSSAAPDRLDGVSPPVRPAETVADGTKVPITLAIDYGAASDAVGMCRVTVAAGSDLAQALAAARTASAPAGCVRSFATTDGGAGVASLNGVAAGSGYRWLAGVDGAAPSVASTAPIGFGDLVFLQLQGGADAGPAPVANVPALRPALRKRARGPRVSIDAPATWSHDGIHVGLRCPRGLGAGGCRGLLSLRFREQGPGRLRNGGAGAYAVASGSREVLVVEPSAALGDRLRSGAKPKLRLVAATRGEDGGIRLTRAKRFLAG
jgi:hypothetical protein